MVTIIWSWLKKKKTRIKWLPAVKQLYFWSHQYFNNFLAFFRYREFFIIPQRALGSFITVVQNLLAVYPLFYWLISAWSYVAVLLCGQMNLNLQATGVSHMTDACVSTLRICSNSWRIVLGTTGPTFTFGQYAFLKATWSDKSIMFNFMIDFLAIGNFWISFKAFTFVLL